MTKKLSDYSDEELDNIHNGASVNPSPIEARSEQLRRSIKNFNAQSTKQTKTIIGLTYMLLFLTLVLVFLTTVMLIKMFK